jgi:hypothetical protein
MPVHTADDVMCTTPLTAQSSSDYFNDKIIQVRQATQHCSPAIYTSPCHAHLKEFQQCTLNRVRRTIIESPANLCQLDFASHSLLTAPLDIILPFLHLVFIYSLQSGVFSNGENCAVITPMIKKQGLDLDSAANYMPVSNLSFLLKLIARLICHQLTACLPGSAIYIPQQLAYKQYHSAETAILKVAFDIFCAVDTGQVTIFIRPQRCV